MISEIRDEVPRKHLPRAFRDVMVPRVIDDLTLKMQMAKRIPLQDLVDLFFSMCDAGRDVYVQSEQERHPEKTPKEIILDYYKFKERLSTQKR
ncbi:MAG TPA: hypothetical protein VKK79_23205 [Candidatus Lokiarchaeia archaeon]|nr:hypothetical protein [Candidatus Lokiarchaeia archaeon]